MKRILLIDIFGWADGNKYTPPNDEALPPELKKSLDSIVNGNNDDAVNKKESYSNQHKVRIKASYTKPRPPRRKTLDDERIQ